MKRLLLLISIFLLVLFAPSILWGVVYYIDPDCGTPGTGTSGICDGGGDDPFDAWSDATIATGNSYYQKCGTTASQSAEIFLDSDDNVTLGAYYISGSEVIGVNVDGKPIIVNTQNPAPSNYIYTIKIKNSDNATLENLVITRGFHTVRVYDGSDDFTADNVEIRQQYEYGLHVQGCFDGDLWEPCLRGEVKNSIFHTDMDITGYTPNDEGGSLNDGLFFLCGASNWDVYDNEFIDQPHGAFSVKGIADDLNDEAMHETANNQIHDNLIYRDEVGEYSFFRGFGGLGDTLSHDNLIYNNLIIGQTVRTQFGGYQNKIYNNIWAGGGDYTSLGQGIKLLCSHTSGVAYISQEVELTNNTFFGLQRAAIELNSNCYIVGDSGTHAGASNQTVLTVAGTPWTPDEWQGYGLNNISDGNWCTITTNTDNDATCENWFSSGGASAGDWDSGEGYQIRSLPSIVDNIIANNIIDDCGQTDGESIAVGYYPSIKENHYYNNIIYDASESDRIFWRYADYTVAEFNALDGTLSWSMEDNLSTDPTLNKVSYKIDPGSPAINTGLATYAPADDYFGVARPVGVADDIGAHEYDAAGEGLWYVCASGSGAGDMDGTSEGNCWDGLANVVPGSLAAGDTLFICDDTQGEYLPIFTVGGTATNPIIIRSLDLANRVTIDGKIEIDTWTPAANLANTYYAETDVNSYNWTSAPPIIMENDTVIQEEDEDEGTDNDCDVAGEEWVYGNWCWSTSPSNVYWKPLDGTKDTETVYWFRYSFLSMADDISGIKIQGINIQNFRRVVRFKGVAADLSGMYLEDATITRCRVGIHVMPDATEDADDADTIEVKDVVFDYVGMPILLAPNSVGNSQISDVTIDNVIFRNGGLGNSAAQANGQSQEWWALTKVSCVLSGYTDDEQTTLANVENAMISNCQYLGGQSRGIVIDNQDGQNSTGIIIKNTIIRDYSYTGVKLLGDSGEPGAGITYNFHNNLVVNNGYGIDGTSDEGYYPDYQRGGIHNGNTAQFTGTSYILNNTFVDNYQGLYLMSWQDGIVISNNAFLNNTLYHISVFSVPDNDTINYNLYEPTTSGTYCTGGECFYYDGAYRTLAYWKATAGYDAAPATQEDPELLTSLYYPDPDSPSPAIGAGDAAVNTENHCGDADIGWWDWGCIAQLTEGALLSGGASIIGN